MDLNTAIKEITDAYSFPKEDISGLLESVLKYSLMTYLNKDADVFVDDNGSNIDAYLYMDNLAGTYAEKVDWSRLSKEFYRQLYYNLRYSLELKKKNLELEQISNLAGGVVEGYIQEKSKDMCTVGLLDDTIPDDAEVIIEKRYWIPKESLKVGEHYFFLCRKVRVVQGVMPRLTVFLSRTSIRLPALLIEKAFQEDGLKARCVCVKRVAGRFSVVKCKTKVPENIKKWVSMSLNNEKIIAIRW